MEETIHDIVNGSQRGIRGRNYTSIINIMKVIGPLFLDELTEDFKQSSSNTQKLHKLLQRLRNIRIFDPACGSGNFLIIAYKELRELEINVLKQLQGSSPLQPLSGIFLTQLYGIEIDDFSYEECVSNLDRSEHQMNVKFKETFGESRLSLPLKDGGNIVCGNATRLDWEKVCPKNQNSEIYILGNPPYLGSKMQSKEQKEDMDHVFHGRKPYRKFDYISCWFVKGAAYIKGSHSSLGFVSTNSICQGRHTSLFSDYVIDDLIEIHFAHESFKWSNFAKGNAGVTCIIIGLQNKKKSKKYIFREGCKFEATNINSFLKDEENRDASARKTPLSKLPLMTIGSMAYDDGNLLLTEQEFISVSKEFPQTKNLIKKVLGAKEFIHGINRYCFWITNKNLDLAKSIDYISNRLKRVSKFRSKSNAISTQKLATVPHKFGQINYRKCQSIIIPQTTSERRRYIPFGFCDEKTVILSTAQVIYDPETYVFGVISSRMHMVWAKEFAGRLETRLRYSSILCYNTFPFPDIADQQKEVIESHVHSVIAERQRHTEKTIAELYDPEKMPNKLKVAHKNLDEAIERCYRSKPFSSDGERLKYLFKLYEEMIKNEEKPIK